ncbi:L-2-hydroxyglutarate dehydrogenase, mitochondrial [Trichinella pseudospiralis]|uniref:L-2-hydroxyglutarate dehydrogenase, mitochondrial n=1 Tax=Trichinella pseudospiralis TaxID=6337 RepID=A0A0V1F9L0_TRIPS|nr:L-2-hydroxyglutarate dehydrogenase, mitochondrial [Trichinella pseudospiralis]
MIFQKSLALVNKCAFLKSCSSVVIPRKEFVQQKGAMENKFDVVVVGGGIVGCATAREISNRMPELKIAIVEKESNGKFELRNYFKLDENILAFHQSSRNSGVIHAGIYYAPGSLKAKLCVRGLDLSYEFLNKKNIPYKKCGKLIVAVEQSELAGLKELYERAQQNSVKDLKIIEGSEIKNYEPHCKGLKAIWSPHTGIVDWGLVTNYYAEDVISRGGRVITNFEVNSFKLNEDANVSGKDKFPLTITSKDKLIQCKYAITCAGLYSDRVAVMSGCSPLPKIVPIRGEYLVLKPEKRNLVRGNIYPVPHPGLPFLGVHFTPRMNGDIILGPNAVLAFKREGYGYFQMNVGELLDSVLYKGFIQLAMKNIKFGFTEYYRGIFIGSQVKQLQRYIPEIKLADVERGMTGVRAQALDIKGNLVDDFVFDSGTGTLGERILHTRNAPSPAATSSLAIAEFIADKAMEKFKF